MSGSVLELHAVRVHSGRGMIGCFGRPAALDRLAEGTELKVRVAPDELLLLPESRGISEIETEMRTLDENGLVIDLSSGYATWALSGDDRFEAFSRLSALELPDQPAAIQGLVAHVPAKVIVRPDTLLLIVSSVLSHHIRERVLTACADLSPTEGDAFLPAGVAVGEGGKA